MTRQYRFISGDIDSNYDISKFQMSEIYNSHFKDEFGQKELNLKFTKDEKKLLLNQKFDHQFVGPPGYIHGGILATICDDLMGILAYACSDNYCVTANLSVNYLNPTPLDQDIIAEAWLSKHVGKKYFVESVILYPSDQICVEASGLFIKIDK